MVTEIADLLIKSLKCRHTLLCFTLAQTFYIHTLNVAKNQEKGL